MKVEIFTGNASHFCESVFSDTPKVLDTIHMGSSISKNIFAMSYPVVLFVAGVYKPVVGFPFVAVDG